jgi:hypothetical protein
VLTPFFDTCQGRTMKWRKMVKCWNRDQTKAASKSDVRCGRNQRFGFQIGIEALGADCSMG